MSTRDRLKEVKVAQKLRELQSADSGFQPLLVSGTNIKTINGSSVLGSGNLVVGGSSYSEGTSFPGSPTSGDKFYRTDLNWLCFYDGTRWLTCHEYSEPIALASGIFFTTNSASGYTPIRSDFRPYLTTLTANLRVAGTNNGTNYWTLTFVSYSASSAKTTIATFNTATYSGGNYQSFGQAVNSPVTSGDFFLGIDLTRFGGPGTLGIFASIQYRLIVT